MTPEQLAALVADAEQTRPDDHVGRDLIAGLRWLADQHNTTADTLALVDSPLKRRAQDLLLAERDAALAEATALRREREPVKVKPLVWMFTYADGSWSVFADEEEAREEAEMVGRDMTMRPLYTTPPDALALVAAAYRDAADKAKSVGAMLCAADIREKTPADAQAALTAIERAAYERGVMDAAEKSDFYANADYCAMGYPEDGGIAASGTARMIHRDILALLTQEGR